MLIVFLALLATLAPNLTLGLPPDTFLIDKSPLAQDPSEQPHWAHRLEQQLRVVDQAHSGELGVYVKDLATGTVVSLRGNESWYLASGIKVPVAIAVLRGVESGEFSLDTEVQLQESDYVDGAGQTNWEEPGCRLTVHHLMEQMLTVSDNTATDMLIRLVGIERVNDLVSELVPEGLGLVTTLADVRRQAYSGFHPDAFKLSGRDFFVLRQQTEERARIQTLARIIGVDVKDFALRSLDSAFAAYYATNLNGGLLSAFGQILQALVQGEVLKPENTDYLLDILLKVKTGNNRIKAGLPPSKAFAHKTGTQHRRACDLGLVIDHGTGRAQAVIAVCSRDFLSVSGAEAAIRAVGEAVHTSGLLDSWDLAYVEQK